MNKLIINKQIKDKKVRLIGKNGEQLGIVFIKEAQKQAMKYGLDLVKIAPTAKPPVCKIIDYGKYKYKLSQKRKKNKKKQKIKEIKEIHLSPSISENDLYIKANKVKKILLKGNRVKVTLYLRGREIIHKNDNKYVLEKFSKLVSNIATIEKQPSLDNKTITIYLIEKHKFNLKKGKNK